MLHIPIVLINSGLQLCIQRGGDYDRGGDGDVDGDGSFDDSGGGW